MSIIGKKLGALVCALALACGVLAGCANSAATTATAEQQANRAYMSQVNGIMEELGEGLDTFVDAVSRNDILSVRGGGRCAHLRHPRPASVP